MRDYSHQLKKKHKNLATAKFIAIEKYQEQLINRGLL